MKKNVWKKRLLSAFTVVALILGILIYTKVSINAEVNETLVIVTKADIPPRTEITKEMLTQHTVPSRAIPLNAVLEPEEIIGKWTAEGYGISKNSFIYEDNIVSQEALPDSGLLKLKENEIAVPLLVNLESSLGNSIVPDANVDLYFRKILFDNDDSKALFGKLATQIRVVAVKDAQASNVFSTDGNASGKSKEDVKDERNLMAKIYIFAVPEEMGDLINKAKLLGEVIPVSTGKSYNSSYETEVQKNVVVQYIESSTFEPKMKENTELQEDKK